MTTKEFKVSVCVMTYNQKKYIRQCLQSVIDQKVDFAYEIIVSDDNSTDGTREIVAEFAARHPGVVKPIFLEKNVGAFENFLFLHDQATGEYVAHIDGDDYWLPGKMAYQVDVLNRNSSITQCWTCAQLVDDNGEYKGIFPSRLARFFNPKIISARDIALSYAMVGHHSTQMYRKSARQRELLVGKCLDYWIAFVNSLSGDAIYSKKILSAYRLGAIESLTRNSKAKKVTVDVLSKHLFEISEKYPQYAAEAKANIVVRRIISSFRGHDLSTIDEYLGKMKAVSVNYFLVVRSMFYFVLQKLI